MRQGSARTRKEFHGGRLITCYAERPAGVWDMLQRSFSGSAERLAVIDGDLRVTYVELEAQVAALAGHLQAQGVLPGERVALMVDNGLDAVRAVAAVARIGGVLTPIGVRQRRTEISHIFADAEPTAVIHGPAFAAEITACDSTPALHLDTSASEWRAIFERPSPAPATPAPVGEDDVFAILYTSGTTGRPKGATLTHLNVVHSCLHWREVFGLRSDERTVLCIPWSHVAGLCGVLLPFLGVGATVATMAEFKRREFLALAERERITHALMVPAMYGLCLLEPDLADLALGSWRIGAYGSAPMPEPTIRRFAKAFPHLQLCNCYGATETTSPATVMPPGEGVAHADSIGKVVPCGDIRVMSDSGCELPTGEEGEFWIGGAMVAPGYWRNPQADTIGFASGYWKSGDIGTIDGEGYVRIADRKKDMINRGGFKVYPAEVESVLTGIDGVVEAAVVGQPDDMLGECVVAFLTVADASLTPDVVRSWCLERIADYKTPGVVVIGSDPLPRNSNGKIQKAELRETAARLARLRPHRIDAS